MRNYCKLKQSHRIPSSWLLCLVAFGSPTTALKASTPLKSIAGLIVQNREITGKISDSNGQPLAGVTITVLGSTIRTASRADGTYSIAVPQGAEKLVFKLLGYKSQEISLTQAKLLNVVLNSSADELDEVVVVGYGTMRKKDLTGSVTQILPDRIANENPKTVQDILRGTAGMNIGYDASAKGGGSIEVRGKRSVYDSNSGHNNPLLVLDGMIF